jgi:hypothetical protein
MAVSLLLHGDDGEIERSGGRTETKRVLPNSLWIEKVKTCPTVGRRDPWELLLSGVSEIQLLPQAHFLRFSFCQRKRKAKALGYSSTV